MEVRQEYAALDQAMKELGCKVLPDERMALHTTFKIGGPADRLVTVETPAQLETVFKLLREYGLPSLVLGKGSDLLVGDGGFRGVVLALEGSFREIKLLSDGVSVRAGAGASLASVCAFARDHGLSGLEFAWGIPGSMGGAVYMNAGAYGGEMKDVVVRVRHFDPLAGFETYADKELSFSYRHSPYTGSDKVIAFAELQLEPGALEEIQAKMDDLMARRKEKQPYDMPSAGSVFKRPQTGYAAALIDQCGLRGRRVGGAQVSEKHAGFIVNMGSATCRDVLALMEQVQETVLRQTGVSLDPEVRVIGEQ